MTNQCTPKEGRSWVYSQQQQRRVPQPVCLLSNPQFHPTCSTSSYYKNGDITIHSCFLVILCVHIDPHIHTHTPHRNKGFKYLTLPSLALKLSSPSCSADGRPILPAPAHLSRRRGSSGELYREEQKQQNGRRGPVPDLATVPSSQATILLGNNAQSPKMAAH